VAKRGAHLVRKGLAIQRALLAAGDQEDGHHVVAVPVYTEVRTALRECHRDEVQRRGLAESVIRYSSRTR
jgi:hypothetical protein